MSREPAIAVRALTKSFRRRTAVDRVSFTVERGEIVGFLGPNGAGKTTVMNIIMGLVAPDHGEVDLLGVPGGFRRKDVLARIGHLQEKPRVYPEMSARAYLSFFGDLYGIPSVHRRVGEVLERVGLSDAAEKRLSTFSRGMQQRACLARVMLHAPELLILDEPTLGLDPNGLADMRAIFLDMRAAGVTLLFSSHQLAEMERVCDSLIFMREGRLAAAGSQAELLGRQVSEATLAVELFEPVAPHLDRIGSLPGIGKVCAAGTHRIDLVLTGREGEVRSRRAAMALELTALGLTVLSVSTAEPTLEDLFIGLTAVSPENKHPHGADERHNDMELIA